jgi:hypothetical protein
MNGTTHTTCQVTETDIIDFIEVTIMFVLVVIFIGTWLLPIRFVLRPLRKKKFYCERGD